MGHDNGRKTNMSREWPIS
jgi:hypothetical protein